jgi:4-amino-4-deoxy-L-arabinose transferase-like glycosyltransferase
MGITPPLYRASTEDSPRARLFWPGAAVGCIALAVFAWGLFDEPFADEYAYITQSFYTDLFLDGRTRDRLWLELFAYDLQPLPKYLIGSALESARLAMPTEADARKWYQNYQSFGKPATLLAARLPFIVIGALGCVALYYLGALVKNRWTGAVAAALLVLNPLYRLHAHRAMSDVPCEAFLLAALALGLWSGRQVWSGRYGMAAVVAAALAGFSAGLSLLCKFSGFVGILVISAWCTGIWLVPGLPFARKLAVAGITVLAIALALGTSVAFNPFLTARPSGHLSNPEAQELSRQSVFDRFLFQVKHRMRTSDSQQKNMSHNALYTLADRAEVFCVQGFGRFGPLGPSKSDSTVRRDFRQDWGLLLWGALVLVGFYEAVRLARAQFGSGQAPTGAALLIWAALSWIVVALYLPMAWDRYLLPIQSANALAGALAVTAIWDRLARRRSDAGPRA